MIRAMSVLAAKMSDQTDRGVRARRIAGPA
jgi:hypothetical protein